MAQSAEIICNLLPKIKSDPNLSSITFDLQKVLTHLQQQSSADKLAHAMTSSPKKSPSLKPRDVSATSSNRNLKLLTEEVQKLKTMNEQLITKVEDKMKQVRSQIYYIDRMILM